MFAKLGAHVKWIANSDEDYQEQCDDWRYGLCRALIKLHLANARRCPISGHQVGDGHLERNHSPARRDFDHGIMEPDLLIDFIVPHGLIDADGYNRKANYCCRTTFFPDEFRLGLHLSLSVDISRREAKNRLH